MMNDFFKRKTLIEVMPDFLVNGIFSLFAQFDVPWKEVINPLSLNMDYYGNHSGKKPISPLVEALLSNNGKLSEDNKKNLVTLIYQKYNKVWERYWDVYNAQYNPINNYDMIEEEQSNTGSTSTGTDNLSISADHQTKGTSSNVEKNTGTDTLNITGTNTDSTEINKSQKNTGTVENNQQSNGSVDNGIYGFNSITAVTDNNSTTSATGNSSITNDLTLSDTGTETLTKKLNEERDRILNTTLSNEGDNTINYSENDTHTTKHTEEGETNGKRTLTRSGNIGVTTSQQMLQSEIELWVWNFFEQIYKDCDSVLTLPIY